MVLLGLLIYAPSTASWIHRFEWVHEYPSSLEIDCNSTFRLSLHQKMSYRLVCKSHQGATNPACQSSIPCVQADTFLNASLNPDLLLYVFQFLTFRTQRLFASDFLLGIGIYINFFSPVSYQCRQVDP